MGDPSPMHRQDESEAITLLKGVHNAEKTLRAGVTTVRCVGTRADLDLELKKGIEQGLTIGPRIIGAGRILCMTGGHGHFFGREFDGIYEARKAAREQIKKGADVIKMTITGGIATPGTIYGGPQLLRDEIAAVVEVSHRSGRKVCVHAQGSQAITDAVAAGVDSIEHGYFRGPDDPNLSEMKHKGIYLVPTMVSYAMVVEHGTEAGIPEEAFEKALRAIEEHRLSFTIAYKAGLKIAMGTDAGTEFNFHGTNARELGYMVRNGMSEMESIVASTRSGADLLGILDITGTIEVGKFADLLAVNGNPLEDISVLERPTWVMKEGKMV
jgi:imidazolonepropionase-like amidohydrolase